MNYRYDCGDIGHIIQTGKKVMLEIKGSIEGYTPISNIIRNEPLLFNPFEISLTYNHYGKSVIWRDNMHKIILVKNEHVDIVRKILIDHAFNDIKNKDIEEFDSIDDMFIFIPIQYSVSPDDMRNDIHKQTETITAYDNDRIKNLLYEKLFNKVRDASIQTVQEPVIVEQVNDRDNLPF